MRAPAAAAVNVIVREHAPKLQDSFKYAAMEEEIGRLHKAFDDRIVVVAMHTRAWELPEQMNIVQPGGYGGVMRKKFVYTSCPPGWAGEAAARTAVVACWCKLAFRCKSLRGPSCVAWA